MNVFHFIAAELVFLSAGLTTIVVCRQLVLSLLFRFKTGTNRPAVSRDLPSVTVLIPAHNEDAVIDGCLHAMRRLEYPDGLLEIFVVNDRSSDNTKEIVDKHTAQDSRIRALHRPENAKPGKPAALLDAMESITSDVMVFFDADYLPPRGLVKDLVAPFSDPKVGATMGRVVPYNTDKNLLTKLIDLERRAGYVVDQTMRGALGFLPQFGGTCGAVRNSALEAIGGWDGNVLAEDTDLTYRMFLQGFDVAYLPNAVCYEESPEVWPVRFKQVRRWAYGHNDCMLRYFFPVLCAKDRSFLARFDAALVLLFYFIPVLALLSLVLALVVPSVISGYGGYFLVIFYFFMFSGFGNFSPYFQIAVACGRDGQPTAFRAAPLLFLSSFVSMLAATSGFLLLIRDRLKGGMPKWDKTRRFRQEV